MRILLINGPPRSGKDSIAQALAGLIPNSGRQSSAYILKQRTHKLYGLTQGPLFFENHKDEPRSEFLGLTPRQAYIGVSETYFKPMHGDDIFGQFMQQELDQSRGEADLWFISDSGFEAETRVLVDWLPEGDVALVRMHRDGCDFGEDSRGYITGNGLKSIDIENNGTIFEARDRARDFMQSIGWL